MIALRVEFVYNLSHSYPMHIFAPSIIGYTKFGLLPMKALVITIESDPIIANVAPYLIRYSFGYVCVTFPYHSKSGSLSQ
jgi:hypothetical protein